MQLILRKKFIKNGEVMHGEIFLSVWQEPGHLPVSLLFAVRAVPFLLTRAKERKSLTKWRTYMKNLNYIFEPSTSYN